MPRVHATPWPKVPRPVLVRRVRDVFVKALAGRVLLLWCDRLHPWRVVLVNAMLLLVV